MKGPLPGSPCHLNFEFGHFGSSPSAFDQTVRRMRLERIEWDMAIHTIESQNDYFVQFKIVERDLIGPMAAQRDPRICARGSCGLKTRWLALASIYSDDEFQVRACHGLCCPFDLISPSSFLLLHLSYPLHPDRWTYCVSFGPISYLHFANHAAQHAFRSQCSFGPALLMCAGRGPDIHQLQPD